ncbi:MAG: alpha/beta fold hydrolase [Bacteroidales bacterium]|nr:alpha/beta fold hydrolase [Bacteroidales bacterium]
MKKVLVILLLASWVCGAAAQEPLPLKALEGRYWQGIVSTLPLNLTIQPAADSATAWLYSLLQTSEPLIATSCQWHGDTLRYTHKPSGVKLTLRYNRTAGTFTGTFRQALLRQDITFTPCDTLPTFRRPQEPQPPLPYSQREVRITRKLKGGDKIVLAGTLTMPQGVRRAPAVVLVTGSGPQNRDEEIFLHKPFMLIADQLTRNGIAVLRYDDRGVGSSTGNYAAAGWNDFADDCEAAFKFLRRQRGIDRSKVGIIGHSDGAAIAGYIAARNSNVAHIVMLAGPGCKGSDILLQQNKVICQLQGASDSATSLQLLRVQAYIDALGTASPESVLDTLTALNSRRQLLFKPYELRTTAEALSQSPWLRDFTALDPAQYLPAVQCPLLAIGGDKDCQVVAEYNLPAIKCLTSGRAETLLLPGLNHLLQHCATGSPDEYPFIEETLAPEAISAIIKFLKERFR